MKDVDSGSAFAMYRTHWKEFKIPYLTEGHPTSNWRTRPVVAPKLNHITQRPGYCLSDYTSLSLTHFFFSQYSLTGNFYDSKAWPFPQIIFSLTGENKAHSYQKWQNSTRWQIIQGQIMNQPFEKTKEK